MTRASPFRFRRLSNRFRRAIDLLQFRWKCIGGRALDGWRREPAMQRTPSRWCAFEIDSSPQQIVNLSGGVIRCRCFVLRRCSGFDHRFDAYLIRSGLGRIVQFTLSSCLFTFLPLLGVLFGQSNQFFVQPEWEDHRVVKGNITTRMSYPWLFSEITGCGSSLSKPSFPLSQNVL